jgi:hypothetical protein
MLLAFLSISSCQKDDSLDPRPLIQDGQFVRLDITNKRLNINESETTFFGGRLTKPGNNNPVVKYNLYVRKKDIYGFVTDFVLLKTITTFPMDLKVTLSEIATALNVPVSSLVFGDSFRFYGETFDVAGKRADFYSLSATIQGTPSYKQAYRFVTDMTDSSGMTPGELAAFDNYTSQ